MMEQTVKLMVDHGQNLVFSLLLTIIFEAMAPSWAIFDTLVD